MFKLARRCYITSFFNRKTEVERLTKRFNDKPAFTVLLGPPSSGKTALVKKVVEQHNEYGPMFHPLQMNLRGTNASSPDALYEVLRDASKSFFGSFNIIKPNSVDFKVIVWVYFSCRSQQARLYRPISTSYPRRTRQ
jgi:AAA+ ATPase superfamily predicted ATPase